MQLSAVVSAEGQPCQHLPLPAMLCVWEGLGAVHQTRVFQVSVRRLDAAGLRCLGLRFDAGQGALERWRPSQIAAGQTARRKLNSSGGGSAAPRGQDGGAQAFVVRVGGWLQRPASSGSGGEPRSKVSDYLS